MCLNNKQVKQQIGRRTCIKKEDKVRLTLDEECKIYSKKKQIRIKGDQ
jgi:hypothetical protein